MTESIQLPLNKLGQSGSSGFLLGGGSVPPANSNNCVNVGRMDLDTDWNWQAEEKLLPARQKHLPIGRLPTQQWRRIWRQINKRGAFGSRSAFPLPMNCILIHHRTQPSSKREKGGQFESIALFLASVRRGKIVVFYD